MPLKPSVNLVYLLYYLVLKPLSWLPLWFTYRLSDGLYVLLFHLVKYRRRVVEDNLHLAFPLATAAEQRATSAEFYRYFCDLLVESIRLFSMSETEACRRCRITNPELLAPFAAQGQNLVVYGGHFNNWEMAALGFPAQLRPYTTVAIYSPLKNQLLDRLIQRNRKRYGLLLISRRSVDGFYRHAQGLFLNFFIADQSPSNANWRKLHWTHFLGQPTGFLAGPERTAVRLGHAVFYMRLRRLSRGHFEATLVPVTAHPHREAPGFITEFFARELESEIRRAPAYWLWTHRRWKRGVPAPVQAQWTEQTSFIHAKY